MFSRLTGQEWINRTGCDNVLVNNNVKVIYTGSAANDTTTMIYLSFTFPLANISPIFAIHPYFPFDVLNSAVHLRLTTNSTAFQTVGTTYSNFILKM